MGTSILKDVVLAKMFGAKDAAKDAAKAAQQTARRVPLSTYGFFLARDTLTIAGGFTLPPFVSSFLHNRTGMDKKYSDKAA